MLKVFVEKQRRRYWFNGLEQVSENFSVKGKIVNILSKTLQIRRVFIGYILWIFFF